MSDFVDATKSFYTIRVLEAAKNYGLACMSGDEELKEIGFEELLLECTKLEQKVLAFSSELRKASVCEYNAMLDKEYAESLLDEAKKNLMTIKQL